MVHLIGSSAYLYDGDLRLLRQEEMEDMANRIEALEVVNSERLTIADNVRRREKRGRR